MPFLPVSAQRLELFYVLNPDPAQLTPTATAATLSSRPLKPDLPVIILLHAAGNSALSWTRQLQDPRLVQRFNILLVDLPCHGFTITQERTEHTLEDSAECVVALLDELNLPGYCLYGEGVHGAHIATWTAAKRPEKLQGLLLASPGWVVEENSVRQSLLDVETAMFPDKAGETDLSGPLAEEALADITAYCVGGSKRMAAQRQALAEYFQRRWKPAWEFRFLFSFVYDRTAIPPEAFEKVTCPVLVLRGGDDGIVSPGEACEEWARSFTKAKGGAALQTVASAPANISLCEGNILSRIQAQFFSSCTAAAK
ncbi:hypothetical protein JCM8097_004533 [Rhodosporidiobolus ruineniae]